MSLQNDVVNLIIFIKLPTMLVFNNNNLYNNIK